MKKIFTCFAVLAAMVFVIGCGGSSSNSETGDLGGKCYPNKTCNDNFICDEESDTCIKNSADASSSSDNNSNSDTTSDDFSECNPNPCKDVQNSTGNCTTNHRTSNYYYVCECKKGYVFDGASCIKNSSNLPLCSHGSKTPCIDAETALIWSEKTEEKIKRVDAADYCNNLKEGGYDDWRLPSIDVLRTLLLNCPPSYDDGYPSYSGPCRGGAKYDGSYSKFGEIASLLSAPLYGTDFLTGDTVVIGSAYARCVRKDFSNSHEAKCHRLPDNAIWTTDRITQNWSWDNMWTPTISGRYGSNNENENGCFFKCDQHSYYHSASCVNPCIPNPCEKVEHSTKECIGDVDRQDYLCKCESNWETFEDHICIPSSGIDGLAWSSAGSATWSDAISYCNNLTEDGHDDWHLPTISELRTLIQNCSATETGGECRITDNCLSVDECYNFSICFSTCDGSGYYDGHYSKLGDSERFWSSSVDNNYDDNHNKWRVNFANAGIYYFSGENGENTESYFRCVRNAD